MNEKESINNNITINDIFNASKAEGFMSNLQQTACNPFIAAQPKYGPSPIFQPIYSPFPIPQPVNNLSYVSPPMINQEFIGVTPAIPTPIKSALPRMINDSDRIMRDASANISAYNDIIEQIGKLDEYIESFDETINYIDEEIALLETSKDQFINDLDLAKENFLKEIEQEKYKYTREVDVKCNTLKSCKDTLIKIKEDKKK